jgi:hypothetical protein
METTTTTNFDKLANIFTNNDSALDTSVTVATESDSQELPDTPIKTKESKEELNAPEAEKDGKVDSKIDYESEAKKLQKRLDESQTWGHKKNLAYVNAKKKVGDYLKKLSEDEVLTKDDLDSVLSYFEYNENDTVDLPSTEEAKFKTAKDKLDHEFSVFKKYAKIDNAEEKYNAFFYFWPLLDVKEQENLAIYLQEESGEVAIDKIMSMGEKLYDNLYRGMEKHGNIIDYVQHLSKSNEELQTKIKELEGKLDNTTEVVYSRSINSKVQEESRKDNKSLSDIWRSG